MSNCTINRWLAILFAASILILTTVFSYCENQIKPRKQNHSAIVLDNKSPFTAITSTSCILCMAKKDELIYLGTTGGLKVYNTKDGTSKIYTTIDGLFGNQITKIEIDNGKIYLNSLGKYGFNWVQEFIGGRFIKSEYKFTINKQLEQFRGNLNIITCIVRDGEMIWNGVCNYGAGGALIGQGIYVHKPEESYNSDQLLFPESYISGIIPEKDIVWVSTAKGLFAYYRKTGNISEIKTEEIISNNEINSLYLDNNVICVGAVRMRLGFDDSGCFTVINLNSMEVADTIMGDAYDIKKADKDNVFFRKRWSDICEYNIKTKEYSTAYDHYYGIHLKVDNEYWQVFPEKIKNLVDSSMEEINEECIRKINNGKTEKTLDLWKDSPFTPVILSFIKNKIIHILVKNNLHMFNTEKLTWKSLKAIIPDNAPVTNAISIGDDIFIFTKDTIYKYNLKKEAVVDSLNFKNVGLVRYYKECIYVLKENGEIDIIDIFTLKSRQLLHTNIIGDLKIDNNYFKSPDYKQEYKNFLIGNYIENLHLEVNSNYVVWHEEDMFDYDANLNIYEINSNKYIPVNIKLPKVLTMRLSEKYIWIGTEDGLYVVDLDKIK